MMQYRLVGLSIFSCVIFSVACSEDHSDMTQTSEEQWREASDSDFSYLNQPGSTTVSLQKREQNTNMQADAYNEDVKSIEERLTNSYARMAAKKADACPKLLQKNVDSARIERKNDIMKDDYCDYFIYPIKGQTVNVTSTDNRIETLLVTPIMYDFANGSYEVKETDKHVIRLQYDGIESKPDRLIYDIEVKIK